MTDQSPSAFPSSAVYDPTRETVNPALDYGADSGMTLREYFAAHAPAVPDGFGTESVKEVLTDPSGMRRIGFRSETRVEQLIRWRWHYAAEMLKARSG